MLKGWIEFEYEGQGTVRLEAGSCVHQPPSFVIASSGTAKTSRCWRSFCRPGS
ncbi:hypothetical protein [Rhizobacter sp. Root404]|uniref:hypothetical protein n=1 Tax=Rhizobacter sp. Root404 TaxID=1736528 RepID=UPI001F316BE5|nr:hypothetical protein [Rhizobacter sp. Root404]